MFDGRHSWSCMFTVLLQLFVDKDTIMNAVSSSHDVHLLKIDNKEDDMVTRINHWLKTTIDKIHEEEEINRNRMRVTEINNLIDHLRDEIDNLEVLQSGNYWFLVESACDNVNTEPFHPWQTMWQCLVYIHGINSPLFTLRGSRAIMANNTVGCW